MEGIDYSWARPDPAGLAAAGKRFAVRYIGTPKSGKNLTAVEVNRLRAAGLDVVAVFQTTAAFMTTSDGAAAARAALTDAERCGMPAGRPIYFALDTNPGSLTAGQWLAVERFLDQAASVLGRGRVGVYAGYAGIERLCPGRAPWGWQTYAWSAGRWSAKAQLQQYRNGVSLAGGLVDLCRATTPDFGQWGRRPTQPLEDDMTPDECRKVVREELRRSLQYLTTGTANDLTGGETWVPKAVTLPKLLAAVHGVEVDEAAIAIAVAPLVASTVIAALPPEVADHVTETEVEAAVVRGLGQVQFVPRTA